MLLRRLHGPYRTGLLSNASDAATPTFIAGRCGLGGLFDVEIVSALVGLAKPDPVIYRSAPEATAFVGDYQPNVAAAAALGIQAICSTGYEALIAELEQWGVV